MRAQIGRRVGLVLAVWLGILTVVGLRLTTGSMRTAHLHKDAELGIRGDFDDAPTNLDEALKLERSEDVASMVETLLRRAGDGDERADFEQVVALSTLLPRLTNISRLKTPTPRAFRDYIAPVGLPVILTDMLDGSQLKEWSWDYVRAKWGHHVFHNTRQGNYSSKKTTSGKYYVNRVSVTLADFVDVVTGRRAPRKSEEGLYITKQKVIPQEELETEFVYPPFYPGPHKNCYLEPTAWIGAPGTFTQGHIDSKDNFAYQILGRKRWTIFPPTDYKYLYYIQRVGSLEWSTALNSLTEPDLEKYPLYTKATPIVFTMYPGEVLYLPRGWTHTVLNVSPALMINTWRHGPAAITEHWSEKHRDEIRSTCFNVQ